MTAPHSPTSPDDTTRKLDLNLTHVAATALAAVTAAVLGSELGAAGTLIGAAAASVITTVGTAVYKASLERSRQRVRTLAQRTRPSPRSQDGVRTERFPPAAVNAPLSHEQRIDGVRGPQVRERSRRYSRLRWGAMAVGALGAFLLAMMVITGFEWASGGTVGGNGKGTTVGRVVTDPPAPRQPATPPVSNSPAEPASETPTETTEAPETTSTTTPDGDADVEESPTKTSDRPAPSEVTSPSPLVPGLPGVEG
ncbi:MAG: hypothetical protein M3228_15335 [Actinomycetota bacterium]|nr:hypothetical protein [Actinomycetota bacterium]